MNNPEGENIMTEWIGRTLSKVTIQKLIGRGGMADVYMGTHDTLNRPVAVKILHGHLIEDDTLLGRFRSEAQAVANLRHPNIMQVYDFDIIDDQPYIVMELIEGPTLENHLEMMRRTQQSMSADTMARIVSTIANALDYAHQRDIVHRDIKPSNVILRRDTGSIDPREPLPDDAEPILTDFGIARITNTTVRTASGTIVGTPAYMSPEQVSGQTVDARSDVYSLGIMTYEMIAGRLPFEAEEDTVAATLVKHITESPPPLTEAPPRVQTVVMRALAKDRTDRYQAAGDLAYELKLACQIPLSDTEIREHEERATLRLSTPTVPLTTGERTAAAPTTQFSDASSASTGQRRGMLIGAAAVLIAVVAVIVLALVASNDDNGSTSAPATSDTGVNTVNTLSNEVYGTVQFGNATAELNQIVVEVYHLPLPADDQQYEVFLLGSETRQSLGVLPLDENGHGELTYVDDNGDNLLTTFGRFEITLEPNPDSNPLPTGEVMYSGSIPAGPVNHIRHLLSGFGRTPGGNGLVIGIMRHDALLLALSDDLAADAEDIDALHRHAEAIVNLIEGSGGENYGDLDDDGETTDPGDGFGLLPGSQGSGYIQTAIEHARFAAGSEDATAQIIVEKDHMETAAQNLGGWAAMLRDTALEILASEDAAAAAEHVQAARDLITLFDQGQDENGNGEVEAMPGEGGAQTVLFYSLRMGAMPVLEGANRIPAPVAENPDPNVFEEEYDE